MTDAWGLAAARPAPSGGRAVPAQSEPTRSRPRLSPQVAAAAHTGIVWLHLAGIAFWLLVVAVLGAAGAAGRTVPNVVLIAGLGAAAGHALFLAVHLVFAAAARKRAAQTQAPAA